MTTRRSFIPLGSNTSDVKQHNMQSVLLAMRRHEYVSRVRLAELTGLSTTTITNLVSELLENGIVVEDGWEKLDRQRGVGRPRKALRLVPEARYALGIHIGIGSVRVAVADLRANIVTYLSMAHEVSRSPEKTLIKILDVIDKAMDKSNVAPKYVVGMGVGASGLVDPQTGVNVVAPNLGWHDFPLRDWFSEHLRLPVYVDNNVRAMALGEAMFGAGQNAKSLAFVYARVGVGAGFVVDGQPYRGVAGAGEIGHTIIVSEGGEQCRCGNTGCLETLISETVILRLANKLVAQDKDGILATHLREGKGKPIDRVFAAAREGDLDTCHMLEKRAHYLGIALANLVNTFNPELIVLGGILAQGRDLLLPVAEETMHERSFANLGQQVRLQTATYGWRSGAVGAVALGLNEFFYRQPIIKRIIS